jgi:hypothetical protein
MDTRYAGTGHLSNHKLDMGQVSFVCRPVNGENLDKSNRQLIININTGDNQNQMAIW